MKSDIYKIVIPKPFRLKNNGSACYFNALLQCLLTYPQWFSLINNKANTSLGNEFKLIILNIMHISSCRKSSGCKVEDRIKDAVYSLQVNLIDILRSDCNNVLSLTEQEDTQEAFVHLLGELIKDRAFANIKDWFNITTKTDIICGNCGYSPESKIEDNFNMFVNNFESWNDIYEYLDDYKCDVCSSTNCKKRSHVINTGSILTIYLKTIYNKNIECDKYPNNIYILDKTYKLVAQIQHTGGLKNGHYLASCIRGEKCYVVNDNDIKCLPERSYDVIVPYSKNTCFLFYQQIF